MSQSTRPLKTVLIGLGMVADAHVKAIAELKDLVQLKGVYARGQSTAREYADKAEGILGYPCQVYSSLEAIAEDSELDFVIVATPPNARLALVDLFCKAKLPMLMEKPIERTTPPAQQIVDQCTAHGVPLGIVFQHRARAASIKLKALIESGELGELGMANVVAPLWRAQSYYDEPGRGTYERDGGGVLMTQAIHTLDLMLSLTGDVTEVQAISRTTRFHEMEAEDFVSGGMTFANGAVGSLYATTANFPGGKECITLHFDNASAILDRGRLDVHWRDGRHHAYGELGEVVEGDGSDPMAFSRNWHYGVIKDFAEALIAGKDPMATGQDGMKVHYLIDALVQSSQEKQAVVVKTATA